MKSKIQQEYGVMIPVYHHQSSTHLPIKINKEDIVVDLSLIKNAAKAFHQEVENLQEEERHCKELEGRGYRDTPAVISQKRNQLQKTAASTKTQYSDIITSTNDYVIISGVPGCGKTTLSETLAYKWAREGIWNDGEVKFHLVFVLRFRNIFKKFKNDQTVTANKILSHYYPDHFEQISDWKNTKTLLILDGFDEFPNRYDLLKNEYSNLVQAVFDLLDPHNDQLPFARIVTSRPASCDVLFRLLREHPFVPRLFEIIGFSFASIELYVTQFFISKENQSAIPLSSTSESENSPVIVNELMERIKENEILRSMMTIPFYCHAVCCLLDGEITFDALPMTYTGLFCNLLTLFIRDHGLRNTKLSFTEVLEDPETKLIISTLSHFAFHMEMQGKLIFSESDFNELFKGLSNTSYSFDDIVEKTGMILKIDGDHMTEPMYQLFHYSFHEFLVALHAFHIASVKDIKNYYIISMVSGLIGGTIKNSKLAGNIVRYANMLKSQSTYELNTLISQNSTEWESADLLDVLYEYQNDVLIYKPIEVRCSYYRNRELHFQYFRGNKNIVIDSIRCIMANKKLIIDEDLIILNSISKSISLLLFKPETFQHIAELIERRSIVHDTSPRTIGKKLWFNRLVLSRVKFETSMLKYSSNVEIVVNSIHQIADIDFDQMKELNHDVHMIYHIDRRVISIENPELISDILFPKIVNSLEKAGKSLATVTLAMLSASKDNNKHLKQPLTFYGMFSKNKRLCKIKNLKFASSFIGCRLTVSSSGCVTAFPETLFVE